MANRLAMQNAPDAECTQTTTLRSETGVPGSDNGLRTLLHASTAAVLARARGNAANLAKEAPLAQVRIVVNSAAVAAALDEPNAAADAITLVCPNTLRKINRQVPAPLTMHSCGAIFTMTSMQRNSWCYVRA